MLRAGSLTDSRLTARPLGTVAVMLVASPGDLAGAGRPTRIKISTIIGISAIAGNRPYPLVFEGGTPFMPAGRLDADNGGIMLRGALSGSGITQLLYPVAAPFLDDGALERVLPTIRFNGCRSISCTPPVKDVRRGSGRSWTRLAPNDDGRDLGTGKCPIFYDPIRSNPFFCMLQAIGRPMRPRPMKPILDISVSLSDYRLKPRDSWS